MLDRFFTRNNVVWTLTLLASVAAYAAAHTSLIPASYVEHVKDVAVLVGFIAGKLGTSPLPSLAEVQQS